MGSADRSNSANALDQRSSRSDTPRPQSRDHYRRNSSPRRSISPIYYNYREPGQNYNPSTYNRNRSPQQSWHRNYSPPPFSYGCHSPPPAGYRINNPPRSSNRYISPPPYRQRYPSRSPTRGRYGSRTPPLGERRRFTALSNSPRSPGPRCAVQSRPQRRYASPPASPDLLRTGEAWSRSPSEWWRYTPSADNTGTRLHHCGTCTCRGYRSATPEGTIRPISIEPNPTSPTWSNCGYPGRSTSGALTEEEYTTIYKSESEEVGSNDENPVNLCLADII